MADFTYKAAKWDIVTDCFVEFESQETMDEYTEVTRHLIEKLREAGLSDKDIKIAGEAYIYLCFNGHNGTHARYKNEIHNGIKRVVEFSCGPLLAELAKIEEPKAINHLIVSVFHGMLSSPNIIAGDMWDYNESRSSDPNINYRKYYRAFNTTCGKVIERAETLLSSGAIKYMLENGLANFGKTSKLYNVRDIHAERVRLDDKYLLEAGYTFFAFMLTLPDTQRIADIVECDLFGRFRNEFLTNSHLGPDSKREWDAKSMGFCLKWFGHNAREAVESGILSSNLPLNLEQHHEVFRHVSKNSIAPNWYSAQKFAVRDLAENSSLCSPNAQSGSNPAKFFIELNVAGRLQEADFKGDDLVKAIGAVSSKREDMDAATKYLAVYKTFGFDNSQALEALKKTRNLRQTIANIHQITAAPEPAAVTGERPKTPVKGGQ